MGLFDRLIELTFYRSKPMNPFVLGYVKPEERPCNRETEVKELLQYVRNVMHVVMMSPRRLGKL